MLNNGDEMVRMTKALRIVENFCNTKSIMYKTYLGRVEDLMLPPGFHPDHTVKTEKDGRNLFLVCLTTDKFRIIKLASTELAEAYEIQLANELKKGGVKQL